MSTITNVFSHPHNFTHCPPSSPPLSSLHMHFPPFSCRQDFLDRVKRNDTTRRECKKNGTAVPDLKRKPVGPRPAHIVRTKNNKPTLFEPIPYVSDEPVLCLICTPWVGGL